MSRMTPADRRAAIVDAALAVMLGKGIAATTARDVAAEMGCSSGLIHHYFTSMDDLLAEAFELAAARDLDNTAAAIDHQAQPSDRVVAFIAGYGRADEQGAFQLWLDAWSEASRRPALQATSRRLNLAWRELLRAALLAGVDDGSWSCPDVDAASWRLLSLLDGMALQAVAHGGLISPSQITVWAQEAGERELGLPPGALSPRSRRRRAPSR